MIEKVLIPKKTFKNILALTETLNEMRNNENKLDYVPKYVKRQKNDCYRFTDRLKKEDIGRVDGEYHFYYVNNLNELWEKCRKAGYFDGFEKYEKLEEARRLAHLRSRGSFLYYELKKLNGKDK